MDRNALDFYAWEEPHGTTINTNTKETNTMSNINNTPDCTSSDLASVKVGDQLMWKPNPYCAISFEVISLEAEGFIGQQFDTHHLYSFGAEELNTPADFSRTA